MPLVTFMCKGCFVLCDYTRDRKESPKWERMEYEAISPPKTLFFLLTVRSSYSALLSLKPHIFSGALFPSCIILELFQETDYLSFSLSSAIKEPGDPGQVM